ISEQPPPGALAAVPVAAPVAVRSVATVPVLVRSSTAAFGLELLERVVDPTHPCPLRLYRHRAILEVRNDRENRKFEVALHFLLESQPTVHELDGHCQRRGQPEATEEPEHEGEQQPAQRFLRHARTLDHAPADEPA